MPESKAALKGEDKGPRTLRSRAEDILRASRGDICEMSEEEVQALVYELQVHQIELEIQNEELRQAQVELFESRGRYSDLYEFAPVGYVSLGKDGEILQSNLTAATILGVLRQDLSGANITRFVARDDQDVFHLHRQAVFSSGVVETCEIAMRHGDGDTRSVRLESIAVLEANGAVTHCRCALIDISEQQRAEELAVEAERLLRLVENFPAGAVFVEGRQVRMNRAAEEMTGYGGDDLTTREAWFRSLYGREHAGARRIYEENLHSGFRNLSPTTLTRRDGEEREIEIAAHGIDGHEIWFLHDVTEKNAAERSLVESLREKETLLREVHHRVKNNLQIVSSLLHFHGRKLKDDSALEIIREGQSRLDAMILVHEQLYGTGPLSGVKFEEYLEKLAQGTMRLRETDAIQVELALGESTVLLPIETAMPLGLIVHELVTDAFKHAFDADAAGRIKICLEKTRGTIELQISDNGRGLPASVDPRNPAGFGLQLVRELSDQTDATLTFRRGKGTCVSVVLPCKEQP